MRDSFEEYFIYCEMLRLLNIRYVWSDPLAVGVWVEDGVRVKEL